MRVDLRTLQPNPMRDFRVDPMDQAVVDRLRESIEEDGFWGGIICRQLPDGTIQIGAGHHRVAAALEAGYTMADVAVSEDLDNTGMIRVYARENATQRGNTGTATAGMIASAIRHLAKQLLTNQPLNLRINLSECPDIATARAHLLGKYGLGRHVILAFIGDIPGVNESMVAQQLALLKESGHYDRIIQEVKEEIEREHQQALVRAKEAAQQREHAEQRERDAEAKRKAAVAEAKEARQEADRLRAEEVAQKAQIEAELAERYRQEAECEAAKFDALRQSSEQALADATTATKYQREKEFNYDGVNAILTNAHQLRVFREMVTSDQFKTFITYDQQPFIARQIKAAADAIPDAELSGAFIRTHLTRLLIDHAGDFGWSTRQERQFRREDWTWQWKLTFEEFGRHVRGLKSSGGELTSLLRRRRTTEHATPLTPEFQTDLEQAVEILTRLHRHFTEHDTPPQERTAYASLPKPV